MDEPSDELQCVICHDVFARPTTLPCGHTYCIGCIFDYLNSNPFCPLCKAFASNAGLHVNVALQRIAERCRRRDGGRAPALSDSAFERKVRRIGLRLCGAAPFFHPHTEVAVCVVVPDSLPGLESLATETEFVGLPPTRGDPAYLFKSIHFVSAKRGTAVLFCYCKERVRVSEPIAAESLCIVAAEPFAVETAAPSDSVLALLSTVNDKLVHFLERLRDKNPEIFARLKQKCLFTLTDRFSIDFAENPLKFAEVVGAMLRFSPAQRRKFCATGALAEKAEMLSAFFARADAGQDPIFLFEGAPTMFEGRFLWFLAFLVAAVVFGSAFKE